jgi:imidazolonepropionase-like amidohydrolase
MEEELRRARDEPLPTAGDFSAIPARLATRGTRMLATYSPEKAQRIFSRLVANQTWQVPTLVTKRVLAEIDDIARADDPRLRYVTAAEREWWSPAKNFFARYRTPAYIVWRKEMYRREVEMAGIMRRAGVPLLAGTDFISAYIFPGFSLHDELALLVEGGLTPMEALQAATLGPARFLGEERTMGTIQKGRVADLVLLDADPLADIHNTQRIDAVVLRGRYLGREERERLFEAAVAAAARP